jgi:hypothetical protein
MRDKLIELLSENFVDFCHVVMVAGKCKISAVTLDADKFADHLIANGVTFAEDNNVPCKKPMTNGDRIRSMSDEGLAEFLCGVYDEEETDKFICGTIIPNYYEEAIYDWLKQPAEGE